MQAKICCAFQLGDEWRSCSAQSGQVALPVEARAGVGLAQWGNVAVAGNAAGRVTVAQCQSQAGQGGILRIGERRRVATLQLDAEREIIAAFPALPA